MTGPITLPDRPTDFHSVKPSSTLGSGTRPRLLMVRRIDSQSMNAGSIPAEVTYWLLAQLAEHLVLSEKVSGSTPEKPAYRPVVELVETPDFESGHCAFKSRRVCL